MNYEYRADLQRYVETLKRSIKAPEGEPSQFMDFFNVEFSPYTDRPMFAWVFKPDQRELVVLHSGHWIYLGGVDSADIATILSDRYEELMRVRNGKGCGRLVEAISNVMDKHLSAVTTH